MTKRSIATALAVLALAGSGCSQNRGSVEDEGSSAGSQGTQEQQSPGGASPQQNPHEMGAAGENQAAGLAWDAPAGLERATPTSPMRIAQYMIPAEGPGKAGELTLFFFGAGQGGGTDANLQRWAGQFGQADGSDPMSKAKTETFTNPHGLKVTTIELSGRYVTGGMGGGPSYDEPGWKLYGAVVEGQGGPWFWKGVGPEATMDAHRDQLHELFLSLRPAAD
ncbi:MAG: hypothetical protein ACE15D_06035 [Candidatus Eisenbacteria bacterium]